MLTINALTEKWSSVGYQSDQRVDSTHPLDLYIGLNSINQKELLLVSSQEPKAKIISSQSIAVEVRKRIDLRFAIIFTLVQEDQEQVFINLVHDLVESSRAQANDVRGISYIIDRYFKWQKLLEDGRDNLLSDSELKGLIGELLFLDDLITKGYDIDLAINGWLGIDKADRDFVLPGRWFEIKCTNPSAMSVHISSIEQLDINEDGELVVYFVEKSIESETRSFHIIDLINKIRNTLAVEPVVLSQFNFMLRNFGFIDRTEYMNKFFVYRGEKHYIVNRSFPRIRKSEISSAVCKLSYDLALASLNDWETSKSYADRGDNYGTH